MTLWGSITQHRQQAIIAVLDQAHNAATQRVTLRNGRVIIARAGMPYYPFAAYVNRINRIPTVDCPEPFQEAWLGYVQTLQRLSSRLAGLGPMIEFTVSTIRPNADGTRDALARLDKMNPREAFMRVQLVALRYGVQIH